MLLKCDWFTLVVVGFAPLFPKNIPSPTRHNLCKQLLLIVPSIFHSLLSDPFVDASDEARINLLIDKIKKICSCFIASIPAFPVR